MAQRYDLHVAAVRRRYRAMPSGAAMSTSRRICRAPRSRKNSMAADGAAASCEHRVDDKHVALGDVFGQLAVVLDRLERLGVAVEADVADARRRDELEDALDHAEPRAQDRDDRDLLANELVAWSSR